jgi:hypothetical protein
MKLKLDREHNVITAKRSDDNIKWIYSIKAFLREYNSDLLDVLKKHWEYQTPYHNTNKDGSTQLDFNI